MATNTSSKIKATNISLSAVPKTNYATLIAQWKFSKSNIDHFEVQWRFKKYLNKKYSNWISESSSQVPASARASEYSRPENAAIVEVNIKPVSKKNKKNKAYWTASWSGWKRWKMGSTQDPPEKPPVPSVEIVGSSLTASVSNVLTGVTSVEFEIVANNSTRVAGSKVSVTRDYASYTYPSLQTGIRYTVRCKYYIGSITSPWSDYTDGSTSEDTTKPSAPTVKAEKDKLTATVSNLSSTVKNVQFEFVRDNASVISSPQIVPKTGYASTFIGMSGNHEYKVRCRYYQNNKWGTWSDYSDNVSPASAVGEKSPVPAIELKDLKLTIKSDNVPETVTQIRYEIVADNSSLFQATTITNVKTGHAEYVVYISPGHSYKVRCRYYEYNDWIEWSDYTDNTQTVPEAITKINSIEASSASSVFITWPSVSGADGYEIQWVTDLKNFDSGSPNSANTEVPSKNVESLEAGQIYYFRIRALKGDYKSAWFPADSTNKNTAISISLGNVSAPPTTWSLVNSIRLGEVIDLYWIHNATDNSTQSMALVELIFSSTAIGSITQRVQVENPYYTDDYRKNDNLHYSIDTGKTYSGTDINGTQFSIDFSDGVTIEWRVCTKGVMPQWGEWSVKRKVEVYAPPFLNIWFSYYPWIWDPFNFTTDKILNPNDYPNPNILTKLPLSVALLSGPSNQTPIGYTIEIVSNEEYIVDEINGDTRVISAGEVIYQEYFNSNKYLVTKQFKATDITLEDGQEYTFRASVSMNSGLVAECEYIFTVDWDVAEVYPNAEVEIDSDNLVAFISPYCLDQWEDEEEEIEPQLVDNVVLSVYRKTFDNDFVEIASDLPNNRSVTVTDPHPTLGGVQYRIVATDINSGQMFYMDTDYLEVEQTGIVFNWDERWTNQDYLDIDEESDYFIDESAVIGSMVKLPFNVKVSEKHDLDSNLVKYIGRKHPVGYYGTQLGQTMSCTTDIKADDVDTIKNLRRIASYPGDVYFRDYRTGAGYWANVKLSMNEEYKALIVPISLEITRVEGGM